MKLDQKEFDAIVERAIGRVPQEIRDHLENIVISVRDRPGPDLLSELGLSRDDLLFGVFEGLPLPERSLTNPPLYPDTILIFQEPLQESCESVEELVEEIEITVVHEIAHYLGMTEEELENLGYS